MYRGPVMLLMCNELLLSSIFEIEYFLLGWYSLNYTKADNEDRNFVIVKCDSERNNIAIEVENDKTYMIPVSYTHLRAHETDS